MAGQPFFPLAHGTRFTLSMAIAELHECSSKWLGSLDAAAAWCALELRFWPSMCSRHSA